MSPRSPLLLAVLSLAACQKSDPVGDDTGRLHSGAADGDGDGFAAAEDCDDADPSVRPDATEVCDGQDNDCDGSVDEELTTTVFDDADNDGHGADGSERQGCVEPGVATVGGDCADEDPAVHPGATELCDGLDNDCDGEADQEIPTWYADADHDGYGDPATAVTSCETPTGWIAQSGDCDDTCALCLPGGVEVCDELDNNCDGATDEGVTTTYYEDRDNDGFGRSDSIAERCDRPTGYAEAGGDCDDADPAFNPGAAEPDCTDPTDWNCDGSTGYADADGDGWAACVECDDAAAAVNPDATEICNDLDDDCDGAVDDADSSVDLSSGTSWYVDGDSDGYGDASYSSVSCDAPSGSVADSSDCDDAAAAVNPAATEVCNDLDDDCDALVDDADASLDSSTGSVFYADGDGDGHGSTTAIAACDLPSGYSTSADDCDDASAAVSPSATEVCDGSLDEDCDSLVDDADSSLDTSSGSAWYADSDADGYGGSSATWACLQPSGTTTTATDCDDGDSSEYPGATETCDGADDDCDGTVDDGLTTPSFSSSAASGGSCNGNTNWSVSISVCGCSTVTITGAFYDHSDGSAGQVVGASVSSSGMALTWDDSPSGGDCDLDIASSTSWSASKSGTTLTVKVSNSITGYSAGNTLSAGYSITGYGTYRDGNGGSSSNTFTYTCSW